MKLAISILNRNWLDDTIKCIDSILDSGFTDYKIYLLDNWSKNNEYNSLEKKYWKNKDIIINKSDTNLWFTWWNNFNIDLILKEEFDYILLLNNDCILENDFLSKFTKWIEKHNQKWIYWPIIKSPNWEIQAIGSYINLRTWSSSRLKEIKWEYQEVDYVTGSCMAIPTKLIKKIWWLDDKYFAYREESDFCLRAKKVWYKSYALNIDGIIHKEEAATKKVKPYYTYLMFRNRILFLKKHANVWQYIFSYIILCWYLVIIFPKKFWFKNYKYAFRWIVDWIKNIWWSFMNWK
jgi:GT2 family glycosyltransferase